MRRTLIALAAATGLISLGTIGASAAPTVPVQAPAASNIHQADWDCGPRCQYWRHRHWEAQHEWREHHPYYSYNRGYYPNGAYYYGYR